MKKRKLGLSEDTQCAVATLWRHLSSWDPSLLDTDTKLQALCDEESICQEPLRKVGGPAYRTDQVTLASSGTSRPCPEAAPPSLASPQPTCLLCALSSRSRSHAMVHFILPPPTSAWLCLPPLSALPSVPPFCLPQASPLHPSPSPITHSSIPLPYVLVHVQLSHGSPPSLPASPFLSTYLSPHECLSITCVSLPRLHLPCLQPPQHPV